MSGTDCCQKGAISLVRGKLGRCRRCIQAAALGASVGWGIAAAVYLVWPGGLVLWTVAVFAGACSLLLVSHAVGLMVRMKLDSRDGMAATDGGKGSVTFTLERRAFLRRSVGAGVAATLASLFGLRIFGASPAHATSCEDPQVHDVSGNDPPITTAPVLICAKDAAGAEKAAAQALVPSAKINADIFCLQFRCQNDSQGRLRQCLRRQGTGNLEFTVSCTEGGTLPPGQKCPANQKVFTCTGTLTKIGCQCKRVRT